MRETRGKANAIFSAVGINFKVNNEISSWQQTVEFYFDENCWQNLQKYGFSFCGKLNVYVFIVVLVIQIPILLLLMHPPSQ